MKKAFRGLWFLALFVAYVWLCRELFLTADLDACLEGGGTYDAATHKCSGSRFGEGFNVGTQGSFFFWVALVGIPALVILAVDAVLCRLVRWFSNRSVRPDPSKPGGKRDEPLSMNTR
jgi:hypothetical protein